MTALVLAWGKIWSWLKRYWYWIAFPVGLLLFSLRFLGRRKPAGPVDVLAPELVGASQKAEDERLLAEKAARLAEDERRYKLDVVEAKHLETVRRLNAEQREQADQLRSDPDKLNEYLLKVGKDVRHAPP
jgi:hypothetical protein